MDINDIRKRRVLINRQISKGFNDNFSQENISKAYDDEFNKAHQVGDIHPNGKWVWTEIKPGKFDWRVIKKSKGSTSGSKVSSAATMSVNGGQSNVATKVKDIREAIVKLNIPRAGKTVETTIDGVKVEIRHNKATYTWPANISLKVGSEVKLFSYGGNSALAKYRDKNEAADNMFAELNKLLLKKYEVKPQRQRIS